LKYKSTYLGNVYSYLSRHNVDQKEEVLRQCEIANAYSNVELLYCSVIMGIALYDSSSFGIMQ
jgi:hypothetical protein